MNSNHLNEEQEFECPLQQLVQHYEKFYSLWDYFTHLFKCKAINQYLETNPQQTFFLCSKCAQAFFTRVDRDAHHFICKPKEGHFQLFGDNIDDLKLGLKGKSKIEQLILSQQETFKEPCDDGKNQEIDLEIIEVEPTGKKKKNNQFQSKKKIDGETFECFLFNGEVQLLSVFHKLYNQFPNIKQLHKYYDNLVTKEQLEKILQKYEIPLNNQIFKMNKVCEFIQDSQSDATNIASTELLVHIKKGQHDQVWILSNETNQFFNQFFEEFPWAIFCIQTKYDYNLLEIDTTSNDEKGLLKQIADWKTKIEKSKQFTETLEHQLRELNQSVQQKEVKVIKTESQIQQLQLKLHQAKYNLSELENSTNTKLKQKEIEGEEEMQKYFMELKFIFDQEHKQKQLELQKQIVSIYNYFYIYIYRISLSQVLMRKKLSLRHQSKQRKTCN